MNDPSIRQNLTVAIEIMTAMYSETSSADFAEQRLEAIQAERGNQGLNEAVAGLIYLADQAILELSRRTGVSELELLQRLALNVQNRP